MREARLKNRIKLGILLLSTVSLVTLLFIGMNTDASSYDKATTAKDATAEAQAQKDTAQQAATQSAAEAQQHKQRIDTINAVAPVFCQNHQNTLMSNIEYLQKDGWPVHEGRRAWTAAECKTIIGKLYDSGSDKKTLEASIP